MKQTKTPVLISLLFLFAAPTILVAQVKREVRFEHLTKDNGLSSNMSTIILKDRRGFMWIGTQDAGLNRYDGTNIKIFRADTLKENALNSDFISCMIEAKDGRFWVGQFDRGLCLFDPVTEKFKRYVHNEKDPGSISKGMVNSIYEDSQGRIWVTAYGGGLNLYDKEHDNFKHYAHNDKDPNSTSTDNMREIKQDRNGVFWVVSFGSGSGTPSCIQNFDPNTGKFTCLQFNSYIDEKGVEVNKVPRGTDIVNRIIFDKNDNVWFGSYIGPLHYNTKTKKLQAFYYNSSNKNYLTSSNVKGLCEDNNGDIWMATISGGLNRYVPETNRFEAYRYDFDNTNSISENSIRSIYKDDEGRLWVSTFTGGVNIINPIKQEFSLIRNDDLNVKFFDPASTNMVNRILVDEHDQLIVGSGNGISVFDLASNKLISTTSPEMGKVIDSDGTTEFLWRNSQKQLLDLEGTNILVNSSYMASVFDTRTKTFGEWFAPGDPGKFPVSYFTDNNSLYTMVGHLCDPKTKTFIRKWKTAAQDFHITCISSAIDNYIFTGTDEAGLFVYDKLKKTEVQYKNDSTPGCINNNAISAIIRDKNNTIWIGTNLGLSSFDLKTGKFTFNNQEDGISEAQILCGDIDSTGNIWLVTESEIVKYTPSTKVFVHFNKDLGLNTAKLTGTVLCRSRNGNYYVTSPEGIISFNPYRLSESRNSPRLYISGIKLFNTYYESDTAAFVKKHLELDYTQNYLSFEFGGIDYTNPRRIKYMYKMEGLDTAWTNCDNRTQANFTNLDPGKYVFRVRCLNSFGISNSNDCFITVYINPPFWRTWWFYIIFSVFFIGSIYLYVRYREARLLQEKTKLEKLVTDRTAEVVSQKEIIEQKNKEVTDSIHYAQKIQSAILPSDELLKKLLGEHFIVFRPKDIVSGDFYWVTETKDHVFFATVDCTGHGVPGGFMCMLGSSLLTEIVEHSHEPAQVLNQMRDKIIQSLKQSGTAGENRDGMDMLLYRIDKKKSELTYAAANNSLYLLRNNQLHEHKADKMPIGFYTGENISFTQHTIPLQKGDMIYTFTDGYADQFGGPKGKKFKYSQFEQLLLQVSGEAAGQQRKALEEAFESWKGDLEQVDDVLVAGVRV